MQNVATVTKRIIILTHITHIQHVRFQHLHIPSKTQHALYTYVPFSKEATASFLALHIKTMVDTNKAQVNLETCSLYVSICNCVLFGIDCFCFQIWYMISNTSSQS